MKVLVLCGSPRVNGSTQAMADAFAEGAKEAGHEVTVINVARRKINGCLACEYCHTKGHGACIQKDDMQEIYPLLMEAEALVLASPVYYFTMSAQLQAAVNRFYCVNKPPKVTKMAMLLSSYSQHVYDGAIDQYKGITNYCGIQDIGIITSWNDENKTEAKLAECKALGKSL